MVGSPRFASGLSGHSVKVRIACEHGLVGGVYGYPAALLLFSVIDALSNYAGYPAHSFLAMKNIFPFLTEKQIKSLADWYRHLSAHQAIIMPGTQLSVDDPGDVLAVDYHPKLRSIR